MISFEGIEWALNREREILLAVETSERALIPTSFILKGNAGYVVFENGEVFRVDIPEEILVSIVAAADILIVSLRGGAILAERRVPISRR